MAASDPVLRGEWETLNGRLEQLEKWRNMVETGSFVTNHGSKRLHQLLGPPSREEFEDLAARLQQLEDWQKQMQNNACAADADRSQRRGSVAAPVGSCLASQSHSLAAGAEHSSLDSQGPPFPSVGLPPLSRVACPEGAQWAGSTPQGPCAAESEFRACKPVAP